MIMFGKSKKMSIEFEINLIFKEIERLDKRITDESISIDEWMEDIEKRLERIENRLNMPWSACSLE